MVQLFLVAVDRHVLDLETGPIRASDYVRLLGVTMSSDLSLEKHILLAYVRHASIGFVRFVVFDDPSTPSPQRHVYMLSLRLVLTIVTRVGCRVASVYYR